MTVHTHGIQGSKMSEKNLNRRFPLRGPAYLETASPNNHHQLCPLGTPPESQNCHVGWYTIGRNRSHDGLAFNGKRLVYTIPTKKPNSPVWERNFFMKYFLGGLTYYKTPPLHHNCLKPCQVMTCLRSGVDSILSQCFFFSWKNLIIIAAWPDMV